MVFLPSLMGMAGRPAEAGQSIRPGARRGQPPGCGRLVMRPPGEGLEVRLVVHPSAGRAFPAVGPASAGFFAAPAAGSPALPPGDACVAAPAQVLEPCIASRSDQTSIMISSSPVSASSARRQAARRTSSARSGRPSQDAKAAAIVLVSSRTAEVPGGTTVRQYCGSGSSRVIGAFRSLIPRPARTRLVELASVLCSVLH
jgi:hypothetical protein